VLEVNSGATLTLNNLTIAHGNSSGSGGGIDNTGALTITNSTLSNSSASNNGGGISNDTGGTLTVTNSTFSGNSAAANSGGGVYNNSSSATSVTITNSILANGGSGANCAGNGVTNGGYNIADDASCSFGSSTAANRQTLGDSVGASLASALANNCGPTALPV
jgi:hypothetical protein